MCGGHIDLPAPKKTTVPAISVVEGQRPADFDPQKSANIKFACPNCHVNIVVAPRTVGKVVVCQLCGTRVRVPQPEKPGSSTAAIPPSTSSATQPSPPGSPAASDLLERVRNGDAQAGRALLMTGESAIQLLADCLTENSLEEPDSTRGAAHIVNLLSKCGGACVSALMAKLGKSRHAYTALAQVGTAEAIQVLVRELASINWRRAAVACKALGHADTPAVAKVVPNIEALRRSTRIGEVYAAACEAIAAIQSRYPSENAPGSAAAESAKAAGATAPLKAAAPLQGA